MMNLHNEKPAVISRIQHIAHIIFKETNRDLFRYNLTAAQANILVYLFFHEKEDDIFQKDIEKHLNLTNPTVTGVVKRLEEKGLIKRHFRKDDARYKCHVLTDKGREFAKLAIDYMSNEKEKQLLKGFSEDETDFLIRLLNRILKNLGE